MYYATYGLPEKGEVQRDPRVTVTAMLLSKSARSFPLQEPGL